MTTLEKFAADFNALPAFSKEIMKHITLSIYAEPGFSDTTADDIISAAGCKAASVGGAIKKLVACGMVHVYESDSNNVRYNFLHVVAYDESTDLDIADFHAIVKGDEVAATEPVVVEGAELKAEILASIKKARGLYVGSMSPSRNDVMYVKVTRNALRALINACDAAEFKNADEVSWSYDAETRELYWN